MTSTSQIFIGRHQQLSELRKILGSDEPEFIAVYGRRRVGKTFLVKKAAFNNFTFYFTAIIGKTKSAIFQNEKYNF